jgi:hypothetical protein
MNNEDTHAVVTLLDTFHQFQSIVADFKLHGTIDRRAVGLVMRKTHALWVDALYLAVLSSLPDFYEAISLRAPDARCTWFLSGCQTCSANFCT